MNKSEQLYQSGQAIWLDNINRNEILNGWLQSQIEEKKVWGLTSNPSIFQKAITGSDIYREDIRSMSYLGYNAEKIYSEIAIRDVQDTADLLLPVYKETNGIDGYVSLEVDPTLANDTEKTVSEAKKLWKRLGRNNILIKIPATKAGIFAIKEAISSGINVNITLIFSVDRYREVIDAYFGGLEERLQNGEPISNIHSVASFFVSRIDGKVDPLLEAILKTNTRYKTVASNLMGKTAIANAINAYEVFQESIASDRFMLLKGKGANIQRPLWASTSTKNPEYPDTLYVDSLILPNTVNTVPNNTFDALLDHGAGHIINIDQKINEARDDLLLLKDIQISLEDITEELEAEGVKSFSKSQKTLLEEIEILRANDIKLVHPIKSEINNVLSKMQSNEFFSRFCSRDASLWSDDPVKQEEIDHRLAWLDASKNSQKVVDKANMLFRDLVNEKYTHALVLGMGGSSLAPEVYGELSNLVQEKSGQSLKVSVLDSSDPDQIHSTCEKLPLDKTVFIVSSKSGGTIETVSLFSYFWQQLEKEKISSPEKHFIMITDPGSKLEKIGKNKKVRLIFAANPDVGGRYSALIEFGLIPAILAGFDGSSLLRVSGILEPNCSDLKQTEWNQGVTLGVLFTAAYSSGRDKLTIMSDDDYSLIGSWIEQLIAESCGKEGKGILPIHSEPELDPSEYFKNRIFVQISKSFELTEHASQLVAEGHPVIPMRVNNIHEIAKLFMVWEVATAVFCALIGVNAFDQPNVQLSKTISNDMVAAYKQTGKLDFGKPVFEDGKIQIFSSDMDDSESIDLKNLLEEFLSQVEETSFIAINAFTNRSQGNETNLNQLRESILRKYRVATTLGFGPRFLHSTGQYQKGGKNDGLFILITTEGRNKVEIPGEDVSFNVLIHSQAIGDRNALMQQNRRVLHIHLKKQGIQDFDFHEII